MKWVVDNAEEDKIDTNKIVVSGGSAGGHLALLAGLINTVPDSHPFYVGDKLRIQAIVNWFGITDIEKVESYLSANHPDWNYPLGWIKNKEKVVEISKKYSPIHYVSKNSPPVLTIHGDLDEVVPYKQAQLLHESLEKAGTKHQLLTLKGGKHLGFTEKQFQLIFKTIFEFLEAHP
jgi:acetyl esterase/lipase